jgi:hypothetical protein
MPWLDNYNEVAYFEGAAKGSYCTSTPGEDTLPRGSLNPRARANRMIVSLRCKSSMSSRSAFCSSRIRGGTAERNRSWHGTPISKVAGNLLFDMNASKVFNLSSSERGTDGGKAETMVDGRSEMRMSPYAGLELTVFTPHVNVPPAEPMVKVRTCMTSYGAAAAVALLKDVDWSKPRLDDKMEKGLAPAVKVTPPMAVAPEADAIPIAREYNPATPDGKVSD